MFTEPQKALPETAMNGQPAFGKNRFGYDQTGLAHELLLDPNK